MSTWSRRVALAIAIPVTIGMQQWPAPPAIAAPWRVEIQQTESVAVDTAAEATPDTPAKATSFVPGSVDWPAAGQSVVDLRGHKPGELVRVGDGPISLAAPVGASSMAGRVTVRMLDRQASDDLIGPGVVAELRTTPGAATTVSLDYSSFAAAAGAGYAGRLRLVALPECALTTPKEPECQVQTDLGAVNDIAAQKLTFTMNPEPPGEPEPSQPSSAEPLEPSPSSQPGQNSASSPEPNPDGPAPPSPEGPAPSLPTGSPAPDPTSPTPSTEPTVPRETEPAETAPARPEAATTTVTVLAAVAATSSSQGDYTATTLKPSSTWSAGGSTGEFSWSYPLRVPTVPGALTPSLAIGYSSGGTDGGVSNTNNQASWVGEGFELANAHIERKYTSCADDKADGNNPTSTGDLCWYTDPKKTNNNPWDNAFLSLEGHSGELVRSGNTGSWRLEKDDGTRVNKIGTVTDNNEYWRVTTPDGTQYFFGKGRADTSTAPATNSKWSVPVAANHTGEPGRATAFKDSFKSRPWRWNLDYVVSPTGNTVTYYYVKETNKYKQNLVTSTSYDRGGYLNRIQYGERKGAETNNDSAARVTFVVEERCDTSISSSCKTASPTSSTAKAWPDVPMDAVCDSAYCPDQKVSPTFFSRKRVKQVDTATRDSAGTAWQPVDRWALTGSFPAPSDSAKVPSLWLASITHIGRAGTEISMPALTLTPMMLDSMISGSGAGLQKPRLAAVTSETGAQTIVEYSHPQCTQSSLPATKDIPDNPTRCMPVFYSEGSAAPTLQWFNKYVVTSVTDRDPIAQADVNLSGLGLDISADQVTSYSYSGAAAWRYSDSPMTKAKYRTWGEWRGYGKVTTITGKGTTKGVTETTYFRGMNGDRATVDGGTKSVQVADSTGATWPDNDHFAGMTRETRTLKSVGGPEDSGSINEIRATTLFSDGRLLSRQVDVGKTTSRQHLAAGGTRTSVTTTKGWDGYGQPTLVESEGDTAVAGDETCTRTSYAVPTEAAIGPIDRVAETNTMPALCSTAADNNRVLSASRHVYGTGLYTDQIANPALETKFQQLTGSGTNRVWTTIAQTVYDKWGRVTSATDTLGNTATTTFTHTTGGLLSSMTNTTADPDGAGGGTPLTTTTTFDTRWGVPVKTVEPGGQTTESSIDALGRAAAVWQPGRNKATQTASMTYSYAVNKTAPSTVTTRTLLPNGADYVTSIALLDSFLRPRQTQSTSAAGGRLISDTRYDSRGNPVLTDSYYNSDAPNTTLVRPTNRTSILTSHRYTIDFAGRTTRDGLYSEETLKWETLTAHEGDRIKVTPPAGGTPVTTISDIQGHTTQLIQHLGTDTNAPGVATSYTYDQAGQLTTMTDAKGNRWSYTYDLADNKLTTRDPDKGLTTSVYNTANQVTSSTDARGTTLKYFYDNLGRPTRTTKADGTTILTSTVYDTVKKGLVTSSSRHLDGGTITSRINTYDSAGRPTSATMVVPEIAGLIGTELAGSYTTTTSYHADGSINTQTLPAAGPIPAETLSYGHTATGLPDTLTGTLGSTTATYVTDTQYLQWGTISAILLGTHSGKAIMASYTRDPATLRLTATQLDRQVNPGVTDEHTDLVYDPAGNITQVKAGLAAGQVDNQCFAYDYQQQLTEAWTPGTSTCDPTGRTQADLAGPAPYWTSWTTDTIGKTSSRTDRTKTTSSTTAYTYPGDGAGAATPHFIMGTTTTGSTTGTGSYTADPAGNTIDRTGVGGQQTLVWDDLNQLTEVKQGDTTLARMVYDSTGNRLLRQEADTTTLYLGGSELTLTSAGAGAPLKAAVEDAPAVSALRYYSHAGQTLAVRTGASNDAVTTLIPDWQGTTHHQVANATGDLHTTWQDPYGNKRGTAPVSWTGERGFVGGTTDATGLIRIGARDYDPALSRFVTVDPVQDLVDPLQWNPYLYANNTPITKADPTGLEPRMIDGKWHDGFGCGGLCGGKGGGSNKGGGKSPDTTARPPSPGNTPSQNPGGITPPVAEPQRDFWGFVANIAVGAAVGIAIGAVCVSTAGIGCLIIAGATAGLAGYSAQAAITGRFDPAEAVVATVAGGALGAASPFIGAALRPIGQAIANAARPALQALGTALKPALTAAASATRTALTKATTGIKNAAAKLGPSSNSATRGGSRVVSKVDNLPCNCFVAGTLVQTADGPKPIEDIRPGDQVWAKNLDTGTSELRPVHGLFRKQATSLMTITLTSGATVVVTQEHPFMVEGEGWVLSGDLRVGDRLTQRDGRSAAIAQIDVQPGGQTVYNFEVAGDHNYYITDAQLLVHNCDLGASISMHMGKRSLDGVSAGDEAAYIERVIHGGAPLAEFKQVNDVTGRAIWRDGRNIIIRDPVSVDGGTAFSKASVDAAMRYFDEFQ